MKEKSLAMEDEGRRVREDMARRYEQAADELEMAVRHLRTAARHLHDRNVPRGCAHAFAAVGHIRSCERELDENAIQHAEKSEP